MINQTIGIGLLILSWIFIIFGGYSMVKLKNMYSRMLSSSLVDSTAMLFLLGGLVFVRGLQQTSFKVGVLLLFLLIANPVTTHLIARSANRCSLPLDGGCDQ